MQRIKKAWFSFNGRRSDELGIELAKMPTRGMSAERGTSHMIPGRTGAVWSPDGGSDDIEVKIECYVPSGDIAAAARWFRGSGQLVISDEPDRAYEARIVKGFTRSNPFPRFTAQMFTIVFTCNPVRYLYPRADTIDVTKSGTKLDVRGTAPAQPRVTIRGKGDFSVTIGMRTMFFTGITDGIIVDSELMDALSLDGAQLLNNHASGDFYELDPYGSNVVSWSLASGARIDSVKVTPRWRYY